MFDTNHQEDVPTESSLPLKTTVPLGPDFQNTIEHIPVATITCDNDGNITAFNSIALKLFSGELYLGASMNNELIQISSLNNLPVALLGTNHTKELDIRKLDIFIHQPSNGKTSVTAYIKTLYDAAEEITGTVITLIPNPEQPGSMSEKIGGNEELYTQMIEEVQDYAILLLDKQGTIQNWNKGAEVIKGYTEKEILGRNFQIFYLPEDQKKGLPQQLIREAAASGRAMHEGWRVRKDGTTFWGYIVITALHDKDHNVIGFSKVTRDLTERKLSEDQRDKDAKNIAHQNEHLQEYAYITSHDLQEPVRKIQIFSQLLESHLDDREAVFRNLEKIKISAGRMAALIKDVLNYSRLSQTTDQFILTDLNEVVEAVQEDFELLIVEKNVMVRNHGLPSIMAIPVQMKQLFTNLVGNAIKFSDKDPLIEISASLVEDPQRLGSNYYEIELRDNGTGFEQKYAEQIFKPFKRLVQDANGTGIGLALCKRIVENHSGSIDVCSEPGQGACFTILLPRRRPHKSYDLL